VVHAPVERLAKVKLLSIGRALLALPRTPPALLEKMLVPHSLLRRSMIYSDLSWNDRKTLEVEFPAGSGVGIARAIARAYSAFHPKDVVIGVPSWATTSSTIRAKSLRDAVYRAIARR
jgi:hypothetical protein